MQHFLQSMRARGRGLVQVAVAASMALAFHTAFAQSETAALDEVRVVSSRVPATMGQEAESLTVITREQIERIGAAGGADLLRQVPGVQVDQLGGPGGISLVYIRGSDPNHVLVLVDGVRMNDPTNSRGGGFDFSSLDPSQIERIEILRGAASSIYGADAMGGVVNIVTRKDEPGGSANVAAGGLGYRALNARSTWHVGAGTRFSVGASALHDGLEPEGGRIKLNQLTLAGRVAPSVSSHLEVDLRHVQRSSSAFPDDSGGIELAGIRTLEQRSSYGTTLSVRGLVDVDGWTVTLEGTGFQHRDVVDSPGVVSGLRNDFGIPASSSTTRYRRSGALLNAVRHLAGGSELAIGAEVQREHGSSNTIYELFSTSTPAEFDLHRSTGSAFTDLKWLAAPGLIIRAGLRHDAVQSAGSHTSPSVGAKLSVPRLGGHLKASYSAGFKPPSFFALGLPQALGGNPDLKAEHSKGGSIGYDQPLGRIGELSAALFRRRYSDLVTFDNKTNQLVNADRVDVKGVEISIQLQVTDAVGLQGHYTRLISKVGPSEEPLRQRPGRRAGIQLDVKLHEGASLSWKVEYANEIFDSSIPTGNVFLRSYLRNDLSFSYAISSRLSLTAAIDNVADRTNRWYVGAPSLGRRGRVGARLTF